MSDERIEVRGRVKGPEPGGRPEGELSRFRLDPHEQRIVPFDGDGGGRQRGGDTAGGLSLEFDGTHGALLARVLVEDPRSGYSASLALNPTTGAKTSTYHGSGLRRSSGDVRLLPVLLGRNLSDAPSVLTGQLVFNRPDGTVDRIALPQTTLEAGETALIDARDAWGIVQDQAGDEGIGVEFEYTSAPGSLLMSAGLVSGARNLAFRVPLIDPETPKSSTGGYPWFTDDERTTTVFLKNTTTTKVIYLLQVSFNGGVYASGIKEIEPGQTIAVDVRRLRDEQVPDAFGNTIPLDAESGQVTWSIKSTTKYAMIGRAEHTDREHGVSASYACLSCCPPRTSAVWIENDPSEVAIGSTIDLLVMAEDEDCYDNISSPYYMPWPYLNDWYLGNTGIATSYDDSTVYGVARSGRGETTFFANFPGVEYHVEGVEYGWYCHLDEGPIYVQTPVAVQKPTYVKVIGTPQYTVGPPATYVYNVNREILDQFWKPITKVMFVMETYTPDPPSGNCTSLTIDTGNENSSSAGIFGPDLYSLDSGAPNPCSSTSTQSFKITLNGTDYDIQTKYTVTWQYSGVTVTCSTACQQ